MVRRHITALVALFALVSANSLFALGLGEMTLNSYLNQRFDAEIEITDVGDLTQEEIIPSLASDKDFETVGVQKEYFLNQLRFEVVLGDNRSYIKVSSQDPVTEPYLDFLVELLWPEGRILREFTVLLDPPSYAAQRDANTVPVVQLDEPVLVEEVASDSTMDSASDEVVEIVEQEAETTYTDMMATDTAPKKEVVQEARKTVTTQPRDTLWGIASRERPNQSVSVQQTMLAIKSLNPEAFEHDNINYLKKNQVLRIPTEDEIRSMATREALGIVADQNREWAGRTLASGGTLPMDTAKLVGSRQVTPMQDGSTSGDQMKVVAESGSDGSAVGSYDGQGSAASADANAASNREVARLASDLAALKSQVATTERMIALKDRQIAELQARLAEAGAETDTSVDNQLESIEEQAQVQEDSSTDSQITEEDEIAAALVEAQTDASQSETVDTAEFKADEQAAQALDTQPSQQATETLGISSKQEDSSGGMMLYAIIGVVVLLLLGGAGFFLYKRRVANTNASYEKDFGGMGAGLDDLGEGFGGLDDLSDGLGQDNEELANIITEADTLISFDRHEQAVELLEAAIDDGHSSIAVKMKLLHAYAGVGNQSAFDSLRAQILDEDSSKADEIDELEASMASGSADDEFDISLDDLASDLDASFINSDDDSSEETSFEDFESSIDLSSDANKSSDMIEEVSFEENTAKASSDNDFELDLDFEEDQASSGDELSLDDTVVIEPEAEELSLDLDMGSDSEDDDSLDLSLDELSFDEEEAPATAASVAESDDDSLDLSLDELSFDEEEAPATTASVAESDDDALDLSFDSDDELDLSFDDEPVAVAASDELDLSLDDDSLGSSDDELSLESASDDDALDLSFEDDSDGALDLSFEEDSDDALDLSLEDDSSDELSLDSLDVADSEDSLDLSLEETEVESLSSVESDSLFEEGGDDDFDLPDEGNEAATKLDLARAYIDMGDEDGAKDILQEVLSEGNDAQKAEANELLAKL